MLKKNCFRSKRVPCVLHPILTVNFYYLHWNDIHMGKYSITYFSDLFFLMWPQWGSMGLELSLRVEKGENIRRQTPYHTVISFCTGFILPFCKQHLQRTNKANTRIMTCMYESLTSVYYVLLGSALCT